jgi:hypothetical protein
MRATTETAPACASDDGILAIVNASPILALVASLSVGLTGCQGAIVFATTQLGLLLREAITFQEFPFNSSQLSQADWKRCRELAAKGIEVTEPLEIAIPTNEGEVQTFEGTVWLLEYEGERYPERRLPVIAEGTLVITELSVILVPPPHTAGVRIPYQAVVTVDLNPVNRYSMNVISCTARFDTFNFWHRQTTKHDPEAAATAVAKLKARVAAFQANANRNAEVPH